MAWLKYSCIAANRRRRCSDMIRYKIGFPSSTLRFIICRAISLSPCRKNRIDWYSPHSSSRPRHIIVKMSWFMASDVSTFTRKMRRTMCVLLYLPLYLSICLSLSLSLWGRLVLEYSIEELFECWVSCDERAD